MPTYSGGVISSILLLFFDLPFTQGVKAAQQSETPKQKSRHPCGVSLKPVSEELPMALERPQLSTQTPSVDGMDKQGPCNTPFEPLLGDSTRGMKWMRTAKSGNPLITVHQSGVFDMETLYCICPNAADKDEQMIHSGLFPSSYKQIETAFTFSVLDDFLTDNLERKTTAQQYYSKLQSITNRMFPGSVPVC